MTIVKMCNIGSNSRFIHYINLFETHRAFKSKEINVDFVLKGWGLKSFFNFFIMWLRNFFCEKWNKMLESDVRIINQDATYSTKNADIEIMKWNQFIFKSPLYKALWFISFIIHLILACSDDDAVVGLTGSYF